MIALRRCGSDLCLEGEVQKVEVEQQGRVTSIHRSVIDFLPWRCHPHSNGLEVVVDRRFLRLQGI
jgi:hypothetical protein